MCVKLLSLQRSNEELVSEILWTDQWFLLLMAQAVQSNQESSVNPVTNANNRCVAVWYFFSVTFSPFFRFSIWFLPPQTQREMPRRFVRNILFGCPKHDWKHSDTPSKVPYSVAENMVGNVSASGQKYPISIATNRLENVLLSSEKSSAVSHLRMLKVDTKVSSWMCNVNVKFDSLSEQIVAGTCHSATGQFLLLVRGTD